VIAESEQPRRPKVLTVAGWDAIDWTRELTEGLASRFDWVGLTHATPEGECTLVPLH
jgi:hypothetical protein